MCILIAKPANVALPPVDTLFNCYINNPDGCGYSVPGRVFHSLDFGEFINAIGAEDPRQPMIIHFRWATHGSVCKSNCHPFIDRRTGITFAHNGVLDITPFADMTDSETAFKRYFMPAIHRDGLTLAGPSLRKSVYKIIGSSKFAFMTPGGDMHMFGHFINDEGVYYSNTSYQYARRYKVV